jgi:protein TonB
MPPITKENETPAAPPESVARNASAAAAADDHAAKAQPVALEISVTVNGARTVEGSDKREPFSESTKTVLVFGNGAVIRLSSPVAPGQLLFLTNEKTKKEVVCQVVKSKNYRNVSGYVELEFTEQLVGFWGMRFATDRTASMSQPPTVSPSVLVSNASSAPPAAPRPVAHKVDSPAPSATPNIAQTNPAVSVHPVRNSELRLSESKFVAPAASVREIPTTPRADSRVAQKPVAPVTPIAPPTPPAPATLASLIPEIAVTAIPAKPMEPRSSTFDSPRTSETKASIFAPPPPAPAAPPSVHVTSVPSDAHLKDPNSATFASVNLPLVSELKPVPASPIRTPQAPIAYPSDASGHETEALKHQSARLQEQLSKMLFTDTAPAKPAQQPPAAPVKEIAAVAGAASKVIELTFNEAHLQAVKPVGMPKSAPPPVKTSFDDEELKIPAWLEPLTRNTSAPTSTQELIDREKSKRLAEQLPKVESFVEEYVAPTEEGQEVEPAEQVDQEQVQEAPVPTFGGSLAFGEDQSSSEDSSKTSSKAPLIGAIAAALLLAAGVGWWYMRPQPSGIRANTTSTKAPAQAPAPAPVVASAGEALQPQPQVNTPTQNNSAVPNSQSNPAQNSTVMTPANASGASLRNASEKSALNSSNSKSAAVPAAAVQPTEVQPQPEPKKSSLGEVRFATPTVTRRGSSQDNSAVDPGIALSGNQPDSNSEALGSGLALNTKQPAAPEAPLAVGGDVKPAKMISSVHPVYPTLAKNQHVSGNVLVDALIDATGRVTATKIVSGPTLLHQAAVDALKQWKYQPATLDGKAVPMHLTVTIQFRLQ